MPPQASASKEGEAVPTVSAGGGLRRGAASRQARAVDAATPSFLLTPSAGNVHAFRAPVACAVFDVLVRRRARLRRGVRGGGAYLVHALADRSLATRPQHRRVRCSCSVVFLLLS